jgi:hypothetical protein
MKSSIGLGEVDIVSKTESYSDSEWNNLEQGCVQKALNEFKNPNADEVEF